MTRTLRAFNLLLIFVVLWILVAFPRTSHEVPSDLLLGFLPPLSTWLALKYPGNRSLGGVAIVVNSVLAVGGAFALLAAVMQGTMADLLFPMLGFFLLILGYSNIGAVWNAFPAPRASSQVGGPE